MLAANLPAGAAIHTSEMTDDAWTPEAQLIAHVIDVLAAANWQRGDGKASQKPEPFPRPSDAAEMAAKAERMDARIERAKARRQERADFLATQDA